MELARDPSDRNIKNWLNYIDTKNKLASRLQTRMAQYVAKNSLTKKEAELVKASAQAIPISGNLGARFRVRTYIDSKCPHCKRMLPELAKLLSNGVFVEVHQIDSGPLAKGPIPITRANPEDTKKHKITSVPFTIIADMKKKTLLPPVKGYQSSNGMMRALAKANN